MVCNKGAPTLCHSQLGKHVRLPFEKSSSYSIFPFDIFHCDVWTSPVPNISSFHYYLVMLDDFSHFCWTFPLTHKSEVHTHIANFCDFTQTQSSLSVRNIHIDNGTKFVNHTGGSRIIIRRGFLIPPKNVSLSSQCIHVKKKFRSLGGAPWIQRR